MVLKNSFYKKYNIFKKKIDKFSFHGSMWAVFVILFYTLIKIAMYITGKVFFDEGVYVGIAKYFSSGGTNGFFEYIRPLLLPLLLTPLQYLPIDPLITGRTLCFLITIGTIFIVYHISRIHFDELSAKWSILLFAASSSVIFFGSTILTDVLVFTLVLASASLAWRNKWFFSGSVLSIAFLLKFPVLLLCLPIIVLLIFRYKTKLLIPSICFGSGLIIFITPYLIFNLLHYSGDIFGRIFTPLIDASKILQNETWIYEKASLWKYSLFLLIIELPLVFSFILSWIKIKQKEKNIFLFFTLCAISFMLYFSWYVVRLDYRYMLSIIPFLAILGGVGLSRFVKNYWKATALIIIIPIIIVSFFLIFGIARTTVDISTSDDLVFTNAGQALLKLDGKAELYPGPNMGHLYKQWYINSSAEWLIIDLEGYPCQASDNYCKEDLRIEVSRLLTANKITSCGKLYGEDVIILAKHPYNTITREECIKKIRGGPYSYMDTQSFVRLHAAVITLEGQLQNLEELKKVVTELSKQNISSVLVIVATNNSLDEASGNFISNLPSNFELGVLPKDDVDTQKFISDFTDATNKKITVIASQSDDWIGQNQNFSMSIKSCVRGSWDQTIMKIPCKKIDLYILKDWNKLSLYETDELYASFNALSNIDYEVGVDIPVAALNYNNTQEIIKLIKYMENVTNNGQN